MNDDDCKCGQARINALADKVQKQSEELAVELGGKMKTLEANLESALERFRTDMAGFRTDMAGFRTDMVRRETDLEKLRTDMAKRDIRNTRWTVGFILGGFVLTIAAGGLLLRLTGAA